MTRRAAESLLEEAIVESEVDVKGLRVVHWREGLLSF